MPKSATFPTVNNNPDDELAEAGMLVEETLGAAVAPANPEQGIEVMRARMDYCTRMVQQLTKFADAGQRVTGLAYWSEQKQLTEQRIKDYETRHQGRN